MVERSTHNGLISVQFRVVQHIRLLQHEYDVGSDLTLYRGITHANIYIILILLFLLLILYYVYR